MREKRCIDCVAGEHENYDDRILFVLVRDPQTGRIMRRGDLCEEHRNAYCDDGYAIEDGFGNIDADKNSWRPKKGIRC